jgi:hypothetical protein
VCLAADNTGIAEFPGTYLVGNKVNMSLAECARPHRVASYVFVAELTYC